MKRTLCSACGYDDLRVFLDLGTSPIADAYTTSATDASVYYPLQLAVCTGCRLVQLLEVVDPQTLFGTGYSFYSSASAPLSSYHAAYAADILRLRKLDPTRHVVEIGCNDGDMARHFLKAGYGVIGVDPAAGPAQVALDRGVTVAVEPFTLEFAGRLRDDYGPAELVIANHVLAHVADVSDFLAGVSFLLADDGVAFIEVQYLPDLLLSNAFDLVYHEHRNFFTLTSLRRAALRWGLHVVDAQLTERQSGSLRVTLRRERGDSSAVERIEAGELWLQHDGAYEGVQGRAQRLRGRLRDLLSRELEAGRRLIGYGAPAKATTLLNFCDVGSDFLDYVIDTTEAKQGRYVPGTGLKIVSPHDYVHGADAMTYLLLAWNYVDHIMHVAEDKFTNRGGRWIVPVPVPTTFGNGL